MSSSPRPLVILVHGFLGSRTQHLPLAMRLSATHAVYNYGYRSRNDTLHGHAQSLLDAVHSRLSSAASAPPPAVHFVTHSFGGVVLHRAFRAGLHDLLSSLTSTTATTCTTRDAKANANANANANATGIENESPLQPTPTPPMSRRADPCRCVLLGPPLRGAMLARAFDRDGLQAAGLPSAVAGATHAVARAVCGDSVGAELMTRDETWFEAQIGDLPCDVEMLVIAGAWRGAVINPLVTGESDGVVALRETYAKRRHRRVIVPLSHNYMLYSTAVLRMVTQFLAGEPVGEETDGRRLGIC